MRAHPVPSNTHTAKVGPAAISTTDRLTICGETSIVNHMVVLQTEPGPAGMDAVFHALASQARRDMLARLAGGELTVGQLAAPLTMSLAAASKHVQVLERAGLVRRRVSGRQHVCRLDPAPLAAASAWLRFCQQFWDERLDARQAVLDSDPVEDDDEPGR